MTVTAPTFQIVCDEPGCHNILTLICGSTPYPGVYEVSGANVRYATWGGETLPDGKHRCRSCRAKLGTLTPLTADEAVRLHFAAKEHETAVALVTDAIEAAAAYRAAEQDGTPRIWRGKALQDIAGKLDDALEIVNCQRLHECGMSVACCPESDNG